MFKRWLQSLLRPVVADMDLITRTEMEAWMAATEEELWTRIAARTGTVLAENESLKNGITQKDQALADASALIENLQSQLDSEGSRQAEAVKTAVDDALAVDSRADAERLGEHLKALGGEMPTEVEVPEVETPEPGDAAQPPADSGIEVPSVPESPVVEPSPEVADGGTTPTETPNADESSAS